MRRSKSSSNIPRISIKSKIPERSNSAKRNSGIKPPAPKHSIGSGSSQKYLTPLQKKTVHGQILFSSRSSDKNFKKAEFEKVFTFLKACEVVTDADLKNLKPPTMALFLKITNALMKMIDARFELDSKNYKDVLIEYLKLYEYPGQISMNSLRNVNSSIGWPNVLSIWSFLVDIANECISEPPETKTLCLFNYMIDNHIKLTETCEDECSSNNKKKQGLDALARVLGYDKEELEILENEEMELKNKIAQKNDILASLDSNIQTLEQKMEEMNWEIKEFNEVDLEEKYKDILSKLVNEIQTISNNLENINENNAKLKEQIATQKYSFGDFKQLQSQLLEHQNLQEINKNEIENYKQIKANFDLKKVQNRRELGQIISDKNTFFLELSFKYPDYFSNVKIHKNINANFFAQELNEVKNVCMRFTEHLTNENISLKKLVEEKNAILKSKEENISDKLGQLKKEEENLVAEEASKLMEIERIKYENEIIIKQEERKLNKYNVAALQSEVKELEKKYNNLKEVCENKEKILYKELGKALKHFSTLSEYMLEDTTIMKKQMKEIVGMSSGALKRHTEKTQKLLIDSQEAYSIINTQRLEIEKFIHSSDDDC